MSDNIKKNTQARLVEQSEAQREIELFKKNTKTLEQGHVYNPDQEHDACGVGLVASIDGKPRREVVVAGIQALKAVWHRGAVDADGKTGDGAGIHLEIPQEFFYEQIARTGHEASGRPIALGMIFLPRTDYAAQEVCRTIVESELLHFGYYIYGWRQVPVNTDVIGAKANATRPEIEQIMFDNPAELDPEEFERELFLIRRRIEKQAQEKNISDFYICSLSVKSVIYKGMFLAEQVAEFYPDLQDERFTSRVVLFHQRYSTNTFPKWWLAQPFRMLAHNGEINTIRGNKNWMHSHEIRMAADAFGDHQEEIKPIIQTGSSDSAALDAVCEVLVRAGRSLPMAKTLLIPEAWSKRATAMPEQHRNMYAYSNAIIEPWDGPAAIAATDGRWVIAGMDRNGLRPMRYTVTKDNLLFVGSETGMVPVDEARVKEKGRIGPGQMIGIDLEEGIFLHDHEIKDMLANSMPFEQLTKTIVELDQIVDAPDEPVLYEKSELRPRMVAAGYSIEDCELILHPMAEEAKEAIGSMGDDTPIAVLSNKYRPLSHFFRQNFSQVTNPPIDSLREHRVMSLKTRFGNLTNLLSQESLQKGLYTLESPVLTNGMFKKLKDYFGETAAQLDCTLELSVSGKLDENALRDGLAKLQREAEDAVRRGASHLILSDENCSPSRIPMPMILAVGGVHIHLIRKGLRTYTSINVRSAECLDTHYFAVLIGVGATTVNAYLAQEAIADRHGRGLFGDLSLKQCINNYKGAIELGLLKIMSKMGISVISSYRGAYNFEALGLSRALVTDYFPGMPSRISGIGLVGIQKKLSNLHADAFSQEVISLPIGGLYRYRRSGESHALEGQIIHLLQHACDNDSYADYKKYSKAIGHHQPTSIRDLLDFRQDTTPIPMDEVESITEIRKRFVTPGMSLGALSPEAHGTLNIAMNRIGAKSVSGEGGEDPARYKPLPNGDNPNSAVKQVASGRFGVSAEYLNQCREIEIKVAQGAKPGEGGQLPGFKVTEMIAKFRHATPGVTLISPPPHHDIYSIEDLAQLIYDLKQINPMAKVCVKLVASTGIGTIAAGVAKAKADVILIAGHSGGTGASPQTSIKYAGIPWEMGLTEVNQVLILNNLRQRVLLRTDGGLRTGRDIVIAAMMGAEEYGIGTASLIAMGCIMVRQCHSNTCPVGVCTQDENLRSRFTGTADKVVNMFGFIAEEVREILASLGYRTLNEIIGRTDLLVQVSRGAAHLDDLDLNPLLVQAEQDKSPLYCTNEGRVEVDETLDANIVQDAQPLLEMGEKMQLTYSIRNTQRAIGARISSHIVRKYGLEGLAPGHLTIRLRGSAGQSLGAFGVRGLKIEVDGDANDYVAKGLSGATVVVRPTTDSSFATNTNTIIGNTVLYGATAGKLFAAGQAGERFAVRNSGAHVVIEGCGSNGCEYMTGGIAVILGTIGDNFAAGMTGGMAFIYDPEDCLVQCINDESVIIERIESSYWDGCLRELVQEHIQETGSTFAADIDAHWDLEVVKFWQICPKEMLSRLEHPLSDKKSEASRA